MSPREIDALPALLPRKVFLELTGLPPRDVYVMIRSGQLKIFRRPWRNGTRRHHKRSASLYYKSEAMRIAGDGKAKG